MCIKPIKLKSLIFWVGTALLAGGIGALLGGSTDKYAALPKPPLSPPAAVFPIVWSILYVLIGIGAYIVAREKHPQSEAALKVYWAQLILNALWPLIFWRLEAVVLAAFWLATILALTIVLTVMAYKINKTTIWFFLPYLIWLVFALYLNIGFAVLN